MPMITIAKEDFDLLPTKISIARIYVQHLAAIAQQQHQTTHEDIFYQIEAAHLKHFKQGLPFASFDSMRKFITQNRAKIY